MRNLKQTLYISIKRVHKAIKINHEAWLKPYIDMNTEEMRKMILKNVFSS